MSNETEVQQEQEQGQQVAESTATAEVTEQTAASAAAETTEAPKTEQQGQQQRKPGGIQRRIDELTKNQRLAELEAEFWRKKALGEKQEATSDQQSQQAPTSEPKPDDFETWDAYQRAVRAYDREQVRAEMRAEIERYNKQQREKAEYTQRMEGWNKREEKSKSEHADYSEVIESAFSVIGSSAQKESVNTLSATLEGSDFGPELLYRLGQDPEELSRVLALPPSQIPFALGELKGKLSAEKEPGDPKPAPQLTRAPKPPTPIRGAGKVDDGQIRDDLDMDEWSKRFVKLRTQRG